MMANRLQIQPVVTVSAPSRTSREIVEILNGFKRRCPDGSIQAVCKRCCRADYGEQSFARVFP